jgi:hypothetical protein
MKGAAVLFDKELQAAVEDIVVGGGPFFETFNGELLLYPLSLEGWVYIQQ